MGEVAGDPVGEVAGESVSGIAPQRAHRVFTRYERALANSTLASPTRRAYRSRIAGFLTWLVEHDSGPEDPLTEPPARDAAVRAYRSWLKTALGGEATTINAVLRTTSRDEPAPRPPSRDRPEDTRSGRHPACPAHTRT